MVVATTLFETNGRLIIINNANMNNSNIYRQAEGCLIEDMDGELLLYNPNNATTLHLNAPSVIILELCDGKNSVQQIIDTIKQAYPDQSEQIPDDVVSVIDDLSSRNVLELVE